MKPPASHHYSKKLGKIEPDQHLVTLARLRFTRDACRRNIVDHIATGGAVSGLPVLMEKLEKAAVELAFESATGIETPTAPTTE